MQVGNALTDDFYDHLGQFQYMWTVGLLSDETYELLNLFCDLTSFLQPSPQCEKAHDIASKELGNIDIYSIYTPSCTENATLPNQLPKRSHVSTNSSFSSFKDFLEIRPFTVLVINC